MQQFATAIWCSYIVRIVECVGEGVTDLAPSDHMLPVFIGECKQCVHCKSNKTNNCGVNIVSPLKTTMLGYISRFYFIFSKYSVVERGYVVKINPLAPLGTSLLLSCGAATGLGSVWNVGQVEEGAISGLGTVGLGTRVRRLLRRMSFRNFDMNIPAEKADVGRRTEDYEYMGSLYKDHLLVSPIAVRLLPLSLPARLVFSKMEYASHYSLTGLPSFEIIPYHYSPPAPDQRHEWKKFMTFLYSRDKVVVFSVDGWELLTKPPDAPPDERTHLRVCYRKLSSSSLHRKMSPVTHARPRGEVLDPPGRGHGFVPVTRGQAKPPRVAQMHPTYLRTLAQTHASWLFGGLAELVDNARDAGAARLNISISEVKMKGEVIPILQVEDNGKGMTHTDIVRMLSFGHSAPIDDNKDQIGHFGVGFKTGTMRIGRDVLVLTQNESSRSMGLLSTSYNTEKEVLEIPIVTYRKVHGIMEMDLRIQSEAEGKACLEAVKRYSPFGEFEIGSYFSKMDGDKNGTMIFIYNLDKWGTEYALKWDGRDNKDITIRSKRVRSRPGQTSREIPLDYSLRSYLEVLFLEPRMIIKIQGYKVQTRRLKDSLNTTRTVSGKVLGKKVALTLGRSREELKRGNCGMFLYWHGRLIEAYRRVGGMVHSADMGRGVIGVIDVTPLMGNSDGRIGVLNTKQGFEDNEEYARLETWLGEEFNKYWYKNFDNLEVVNTKGDEFEPDRDWVQCDKCRKWRKLPRGVHSHSLPEDWFCYMEPFLKECSEMEEQADEDIFTVGTNRTSTSACAPTHEVPRPRIVTPKEEIQEEDDDEEMAPVITTKRQSSRNVSLKDTIGTSSQALVPATETILGNRAGKRQGSVTPPRRRLRKRN